MPFGGALAVPHNPRLHDLVLWAVAVVLHRVPADAALDGVAVQVVGEAQVLVHRQAVVGHHVPLAHAAAGLRAAPVRVQQVAGRVEREGFALGGLLWLWRAVAALRGQDAAQRVVAVVAVAAQAIPRGDEVTRGVVAVVPRDAVARGQLRHCGQALVPVPQCLL
ncbi:hypothetical protein [Acidovorax sp. PRC11]|uniref:hypothetical protein n=1 Tax=Acidovorax sp. PRC11 TaxID=2962592 RepID=UPI002881E718|nr:hypothetical protein [Acidovorax sp. PRC11]MDT0137953.1 hypothetical protein [Acidovorax sp. PRC11]